MKWYGWTAERADDEWDAAVRDQSVKRKHDEFGNLTLAKLKTDSTQTGTRVGNKRAVGETKDINVGDEAAIQDTTESGNLRLPKRHFNL